MADVHRRREHGRGERVLPGVYRLRVPLPWPGVPHGNAWAVRRGDGFVLFDCGLPGAENVAELERALTMCDLELAQTKLVVCTHAHLDHCGAAPHIAGITGCEIFLHPSHAHLLRLLGEPDELFAARLQNARRAGLPEELIETFSPPTPFDRAGVEPALAAYAAATPLMEGVRFETDVGTWVTHYTPGHSPSHVVLSQPERRLLISGDHLLGRISLYFDYGYTPDPCGEFLASLDLTERLGARLCLPGHGRTFADVYAHIRGNRDLVAQRLAEVRGALANGPRTAYEVIRSVYGDDVHGNIGWLLAQTASFLTHLQAQGEARALAGDVERWAP